MFFPEQLINVEIHAPRAHQRIISKLTTGLGVLYYREKRIALEPLPETMIDEGQTSPVPDIQLYDNEDFKTPVIIEVAHPNGVKNDFKKVERLIEDYEYGIPSDRNLLNMLLREGNQLFDSLLEIEEELKA